MDDKLEKFIRDHKSEFNDLQPSKNLWNKIEKNIPNQPKTPRIEWKRVMWRAAAVLVIFTSSFFANEMWHQYRNNDVATHETIKKKPVKEIKIPELLEAEVYYTSKMDEKMKEFEEYENYDSDLQEELKVEMDELNRAFEELKTDLKDDLSNKEIVEAMIQNYRIKLTMLEEIVKKLRDQKAKKGIKTEKNETIEYEI